MVESGCNYMDGRVFSIEDVTEDFTVVLRPISGRVKNKLGNHLHALNYFSGY